jgi:hypothetical protein
MPRPTRARRLGCPVPSHVGKMSAGSILVGPAPDVALRFRQGLCVSLGEAQQKGPGRRVLPGPFIISPLGRGGGLIAAQ